MKRRVCFACAVVAIATSTVALRAHADDAIRVKMEGCPLDGAELERLVRLELSSVLDSSEDASSYEVTIRCSGNDVLVEIFDPLTSKTLKRRVVAPPSDAEEAERQLAITIAQLYRASWLELESEPKKGEPPLPPRDPPRTTVPEVRAARRLARPPSNGAPADTAPSSLGSVGLVFGARVRRLQAPLVLPSLELTGSWSPTGELFWLSLTGGVEYANVDRASGAVDVIVGKVLAGGAIEPLVSGPWSGFAEASVGFAVNQIAPSDVQPRYAAAGTVRGAGFESTLGLGVALCTGPVRFELLGRAGALAGTPIGRVAADDDIDLDGPWAGGDFRARWMF